MLLILPQALNVPIFNVMPTSYWPGHPSGSDPWIPDLQALKRIRQSNPQLHCCATGHSTVDWLSKWKKTSNQTVLLRFFIILLHFKQYRSAKHKHSAAVGPSKIHPEVLETFPSIPGTARWTLTSTLKAKLLQKEVLLLLQSHHLNLWKPIGFSKIRPKIKPLFFGGRLGVGLTSYETDLSEI